MDVTEGRSPLHGDLLKLLPKAPCYLLRPERDGGLQWIAAARADWQLIDERPDIEALAHAVGVSAGHLWRIKAAPAMPPGNKVIAGLVMIGSKAHGVPRATALDQIFWLFDPDDRAAVARLLGYLTPDFAAAA